MTVRVAPVRIRGAVSAGCGECITDGQVSYSPLSQGSVNAM
ncbi:hypothetical protein GA0070624_4746 [Micromonospora rhizosphaerae]|uniref:Uncharacterized protein n=1 Tax=Micromonospora rhizosphaerae TaxID=568872 RepID=A0A1C6SWI9_9ACTN|nr:hypothetical protein GA0070624_4746 [Micromonospora rhizosphaerae]